MQDQLAKNGVESDLIWLGNAPVADCIACGYCGKKGECVFKDEVNDLGDKMGTVYGGIIAGSPVYYSGVSGRLGSFLDRLFYSHGKNLRGLIGAAVTSARRGGNTAAFERVNQYYLMSDMIVPGSQYWNIVHGFTAEDVEKDLEGSPQKMLRKTLKVSRPCAAWRTTLPISLSYRNLARPTASP